MKVWYCHTYVVILLLTLIYLVRKKQPTDCPRMKPCLIIKRADASEYVEIAAVTRCVAGTDEIGIYSVVPFVFSALSNELN